MAGSPLKKVRIVLLRPRHPGNIGAIARVMKNMGLSRLVLVEPGEWETPEALAMAWNSREILESAEIYRDLRNALEKTTFVLGTSSRRGRRAPLSPEEGVRLLLRRARTNTVAVLFGPEDKGLSNEELSLCHSHIAIPSSPRYPSLNLAQAAAIVCYEMFQSAHQRHPQHQPVTGKGLASLGDLEGLFSHLRTVLLKIGFLDPKRGLEFMGDIKAIFQRAHLDKREVRILRGILRQVEWYGREGT